MHAPVPAPVPAAVPASAPAVSPRRPFRFNGWHMTGILTVFFGIVFVVNFYMAHLATSTFSGEVVENSYNASQVYNKWLDEAAREKALGWTAIVARQSDGRLVVRVSGRGTQAAILTAEAWRPLGEAGIRSIAFARGADGNFLSNQKLASGRWRLRLTLSAGGHEWRSVELI